MRRLAPLFLVAGTLVGLPAAAQAPQKPPAKSIFQQVIPQPTGKNGYEDLVLAIDALQKSRYYPAIQKMEALTLAEKRAVLDDRNGVRALQLIRTGLQKPVAQPRQMLDYTTTLPELGPMRDLAKLLALQQYVALADGRTTEALQIARQGIRLGRVVQMDTLLSGLVGIAISTLCIQPLGRHLDQLSARDTAVLYQICLEWLNQPNPQVAIFASEHRLTKIALAGMREQVKRGDVEGVVKQLGLKRDELKDLEAIIPRTPEAIDALFLQAAERYDAYSLTVMAELRKPAWERKMPEPLKPEDPGGHLASMLIPSFQHVDNVYTREQAQIQLLACHAAIRRYRWEHDRLPSSLDELRLGTLAIDPYTGSPLRYEVKGKRYSLLAAGAEARNLDDPGVVNGRVPVTLTPDD